MTTPRPHDFTDDALIHPEAKIETRKYPLDILREQSSILWSHEHQALRHDWLELAGVGAPTLQMLLDQQALKPNVLPAQFIGVDRDHNIITGCQKLYGPDAPAKWVHGSVEGHLRDRKAFQGVGVLVYDSERSVRGKSSFEAVLPVITHFARRQEDRLGEFLLILNAVQMWTNNDDDVVRYRRMIGKAFGIDPDKIDLHPYRSKITTMIWTALRLGF